MEKSILLFIDGTPKVNLVVEKTGNVGDLKRYIKNIYGDYDPSTATFLLNDDRKLDVLDTDKYDHLTFEPVWESMSDPKIFIENKETKEKKEKQRQFIERRRERIKIGNENVIKDFNIQVLSQEEISSILSARVKTEKKNVKVLLLCVSADEMKIVDNVTNTAKFLFPSAEKIEFFVANPEKYENLGPSRGKNRKMWIDRDHYFQLSFGKEKYSNLVVSGEQQFSKNKRYPEFERMVESGPYDIIMYVHCPIFGSRNIKLLGKEVKLEGEQLNLITDSDSILLIKPFLSHIPRYVILALKEIGFELIGATQYANSAGIFMKGV